MCQRALDHAVRQSRVTPGRALRASPGLCGFGTSSVVPSDANITLMYVSLDDNSSDRESIGRMSSPALIDIVVVFIRGPSGAGADSSSCQHRATVTKLTRLWQNGNASVCSHSRLQHSGIVPRSAQRDSDLLRGYLASTNRSSNPLAPRVCLLRCSVGGARVRKCSRRQFKPGAAAQRHTFEVPSKVRLFDAPYHNIRRLAGDSRQMGNGDLAKLYNSRSSSRVVENLIFPSRLVRPAFSTRTLPVPQSGDSRRQDSCAPVKLLDNAGA